VKALKVFLSQSRTDRALLLQSLAALLTVRAALHLWSIDRLRAWAGQPGNGSEPVDNVVWAVGTMARSLRGTSCLASALTLQRLLARNGHSSEVHIGVARAAGAFAAHAWVIREGSVLIDTEDHTAYSRLVTWHSGADGQPPAGRSTGERLRPT
jgi:hypothetical protein